MNELQKIQELWNEDTEWWDDFTHGDFKQTDDVDIPDWFEDEKYEEYKEEMYG